MASVLGFTGIKHGTPVEYRVGVVDLIQDDDGVSDVTVHVMRPEVGSVHFSPLSSLNWE